MNKKVNMYTGLVSIVFGVFVIILSLNLPVDFLSGKRTHMFLPLGAAVVMTVSGLIIFIKNYKAIKVDGLPPKEKKEESEKHFKLIVITIILSIFYAYFFKKAGYVLATTIYLSAELFVLRGTKKWISNIIIPLAFSYIIVLTFGRFLQIYLPTLT